MILRSRVRAAQHWSYELFVKAGVPIRADEESKIEIVDFGLGDFDAEGMHLFTMVSNSRYAAKALALSRWQTEPEHWHPRIGDDPGKQETVRVLFGTMLFYLPGEGRISAGRIPCGKEAVYTCRREVVLERGDQLTLEPGQKHWFQAPDEPCIIYTFSSTAHDALDGFSDPMIERKTTITEDE